MLTVDNPNEDLTEISFNGHALGQSSDGDGYTFTNVSSSWLYANGSQRVHFIDLNGTNFSGSSIDNSTLSFGYDAYNTDTTNITISYNRFNTANPTCLPDAGGIIPMAGNGTYRVAYIFGTAMTENSMGMLYIIPILFIVVVIYSIYKRK
jgi:hypothetical protein